MMMNLVLGTVLVFGTAWATEVTHIPVSLMVVDLHGREVKEFSIVEFLHRDSRVSYAAAMRSGRGVIPVGEYSITIRSVAGDYHTPRRTLVFPETLLVLPNAEVQGLDRAGFKHTAGRIKNAPPGLDRLWIRVVSLETAGSSRATQIRPDGSFTLYQLVPGKHLVLLFRGADLVGVQPIIIDAFSGEIRLDFSSTGPSSLHRRVR